MTPAAPAPVDRSTLRLSEAARHVVIPEGIVDTLWFDIDDRCREWGVTFDPWQDGLGQAMFGLRSDGMFAATVGGIAMSIPRQVAKTFLVSRSLMALCSLYPDLTFLWTAHRLSTATMTFQKLKGFATSSRVRPFILPGRNNGTAIRDANGEQEIPFVTGSRILFGAREQGFGRGYDEVDGEVFDEAQILTEKALEDMVAATNQSRFPHGALLFYMGTPPRPIDNGEVFTARRDEALATKGDRPDFSEAVAAGDALYVECSADSDVGTAEGPSLDDPRQVELANPSYPHRTPPVSIKRLRKNLPSADGWRREGLGVWDRAGRTKRLFDPDKFAALTAPPPDAGSVSYAVKFSADGARVSVGVACENGPCPFVEVAGSSSTSVGLKGLTAWLAERAEAADAIVIDGKAAAGSLTESLLDAGVSSRKIVRPTFDEVVTANTNLVESVRNKALSHAGQPGMALLVQSAVRGKPTPSGGWNFASLTPGLDLTPLQAAALALQWLGGPRTKSGRKQSDTTGTATQRRRSNTGRRRGGQR